MGRDGFVTIYEDWDEREDGVYYKWRLEGEKNWHEKRTALKQKPWISWKKLPREEYNLKYPAHPIKSKPTKEDER